MLLLGQGDESRQGNKEVLYPSYLYSRDLGKLWRSISTDKNQGQQENFEKKMHKDKVGVGQTLQFQAGTQKVF